MEIRDLNKSDFAVIAKKNGSVTRQTVIENGVLYEQLTVDEIQYRHKLLSVRPLSKEALDRKAYEAQPGVMPSRLREGANGEIMAFVCLSKTVLYYHIPIGTKLWKAHAQQVVFNYAKSLVTKAA